MARRSESSWAEITADRHPRRLFIGGITVGLAPKGATEAPANEFGGKYRERVMLEISILV